MTEEGAWIDWVLYILEAIEVTAAETHQQVIDIRKEMERAQKIIQSKVPKIYSKDLIEVIFKHPYSKVRFLEEAGIAKRQTANLYLNKLEELGLLQAKKVGFEKYYINKGLIKILST